MNTCGVRLDPKHGAMVFCGEHIQEIIRSLTNVADPLAQFGEHHLTPQLFALGIQHDALEVAGVRDFAKSQGARAKGILPIKVSFPAFGPSLFLVAELTSASQVPTSSLSYQRGKKGGAR